MKVESSPESVFNLSVIIPLHHNPGHDDYDEDYGDTDEDNRDNSDDVEPAHHVEQIRKLQKAGHIWVDLNGQVLNERS